MTSFVNAPQPSLYSCPQIQQPQHLTLQHQPMQQQHRQQQLTTQHVTQIMQPPAPPPQLHHQPVQQLQHQHQTAPQVQQQQQQQQQPVQSLQLHLQPPHPPQLHQPAPIVPQISLPPPIAPIKPSPQSKTCTFEIMRPFETKTSANNDLYRPKGRKAGQNSVMVLNTDNHSVSLLSTRKGKTARNARSNNTPAVVEEVGAKPKLKVSIISLAELLK